jgi:hypothetical protein
MHFMHDKLCSTVCGVGLALLKRDRRNVGAEITPKFLIRTKVIALYLVRNLLERVFSYQEFPASAHILGVNKVG